MSLVLDFIADGPPKERRNVIDRMWARTIKDGECYLWIGGRDKWGYGRIYYQGKQRLLHRVSAHLFLDFDLSSVMQINHKNECNFRTCWNPEHLYIGTHQQNMDDMKWKYQLKRRTSY